MQLEGSVLGKRVDYIDHYTPSLLFPILRSIKRDEIAVPSPLPFTGVDIWNGYELSWLNLKGKPIVAMLECVIPCDSLYLIESKSFKLYLNSFNQSRFAELSEVQALLIQDLSAAAGKPVKVSVWPLDQVPVSMGHLSGYNLDDLDVQCDCYEVNAELLHSSGEPVSEVLHSHLLKSNCLVTGQPDWGSVEIAYTGPKIAQAELLQYIVSFRQHNEFHEQCVERIFMDIMRRCQPSELTVRAYYTRRGGLDINPIRSNRPGFVPANSRLIRQ